MDALHDRMNEGHIDSYWRVTWAFSLLKPLRLAKDTTWPTTLTPKDSIQLPSGSARGPPRDTYEECCCWFMMYMK